MSEPLKERKERKMERKIMITPEVMEKADTYIPLMEKQKMAETIAQQCVVAVKMTMVGSEGTGTALPNRYQENQILTNLYLMGILAKRYLKIAYEGEDDVREDNPYYGLQMPMNLYDSFAGSHVMNQLEILKADKHCRDKVYDLLYDYRKMQRMLNAEITTVLEHQNDVVWRLLGAMETAVNGAVNDALESTAEKDTPEKPEKDKIADARKKLEQLKDTKERLNSTYEKLAKHLAVIEGAAHEKTGEADA